MDKKLIQAIKKIHEPDGWVHFSTIGPDGGPHVTPLMMGIHEEGLLFSFTGKQKKRNLLMEKVISGSVKFKILKMLGTVVFHCEDLEFGNSEILKLCNFESSRLCFWNT